MLYQIRNGAVSYSGELILKNINFEIKNDREKIAVVGRNGCGKTTLLKLITGEVELEKRDSDEDVFISKTGNPVIGYLKQISFEDKTVSMETEIRKVFAPILKMKQDLDDMVLKMESDSSIELSSKYTQLEEQFKNIGGYYYEKEYEVIIKKFGFSEEDKKKPLAEFSGGQLTKIAFIKLLLEKPDILLLDEPTNHLDIETVEWLEGYLKDYPKAVVVVSHDRMFLDRIVDTVYEIEYGRITRYPGNYTKFVETKKLNHDKQLKEYEAQQKEIARLMELVERFKNTPTKVAMTRSKLKAIEHMDKIECPDRFDTRSFKASFKPLRETGKDLLFVKDLEIGYDSTLAKVNLDMKKGQRIGIVGGNGIGKSTFLKTLVGAIEPLGGEYKYGVNCDVGYFDQQMAQYNSNKQVIEDYWDEFPRLTETEVRNDLGAFLFRGEDVFKDVNMLSGGEKVRLALCKIFKTGPNFLMLDEPTNHMDIVGKETLESMLEGYEGSVLFVSHDRYFVNRVATQVLAFEKDGVKFYPFGYAQYEEEKQKELEATPVRKDQKPVEDKPAKAAYYNPGKERSKLEKKLEKAEALVQETESLLDAKKKELEDPSISSNYGKLSEIQKEIDELEEKLLEYMEEWSSLEGELSKL